MEKDEEVEGMLLRQNQEKYYEFCRDLVPDVVGRNRFKARVIGDKPFIEVVTRSYAASLADQDSALCNWKIVILKHIRALKIELNNWGCTTLVVVVQNQQA